MKLYICNFTFKANSTFASLKINKIWKITKRLKLFIREYGYINAPTTSSILFNFLSLTTDFSIWFSLNSLECSSSRPTILFKFSKRFFFFKSSSAPSVSFSNCSKSTFKEASSAFCSCSAAEERTDSNCFIF